MKICAIIPAAGRGSRLGMEGPKLLAQLSERDSIWTILREKLYGLVDHIHVVVSPAALAACQSAILGSDIWTDSPARVSIGVQPRPVGMGDAIFCCHPVWSQARTIVVIWGDQVHVSRRTIKAACDLHEAKPRRIILPVVSLSKPYVEYHFKRDGCLAAIMQSREGERCAPGGLGDVGTFALSTGGLLDEWSRYLAEVAPGARTGEINFLPFLRFLSDYGWEVKRLSVADPLEARGINTPEDLAFFRTLYGGKRAALQPPPF